MKANLVHQLKYTANQNQSYRRKLRKQKHVECINDWYSDTIFSYINESGGLSRMIIPEQL